MKEYIVKADFLTEGDEFVLPDIVSELIRCKDCKHRPYKNEGGDIRPPRVQDSFYDMTCPYLCDDSWYNRIPSDKQYCDRAEPKETE